MTKTVKVKIGDKEYEIGSLNSFDLDLINESQKGKKLTELQKSFDIYLFAIKKYNDDVKINLEEFMKSFPLKDMQEKLKKINEITGVNFIQAGKK